jgi:hypothetical protein
LIAMRDPHDGAPYLIGEIYARRQGDKAWWNENNGRLLRAAEYWWLPEEELLATLPSEEAAHAG